MSKSILEMSKKDFESVPRLHSLFEKDLYFDSLVIIPTDEMHDSGYRCMEYVAADENGNPVCKFGGDSDVIHIDGIMGLGNHDYREPFPEFVRPKRWNIDVIPCGYVRIFCHGFRLTTDGVFISDLMLYAENRA